MSKSRADRPPLAERPDGDRGVGPSVRSAAITDWARPGRVVVCIDPSAWTVRVSESTSSRHLQHLRRCRSILFWRLG
jgi:hypothetical protein